MVFKENQVIFKNEEFFSGWAIAKEGMRHWVCLNRNAAIPDFPPQPGPDIFMGKVLNFVSGPAYRSAGFKRILDIESKDPWLSSFLTDEIGIFSFVIRYGVCPALTDEQYQVK
jgi:hypothetical protein